MKYAKRGDGEIDLKKEILSEYIDACELIKETERDISRLKRRRQTIVTESVKGSMNDFPYAETHFKVEGIPYTYSNDVLLRAEEELLVQRKTQAEAIKVHVEKWMNTIPLRMQRIIRYHLFDGLSWAETADKMGKKSTEESIKKEFQRFMQKK